MIVPKPEPGLPPPGWIVQVKRDGVRVILDLLRREAWTRVGAPVKVGEWAIGMPPGIYDGEMVDRRYYPFDCMNYQGVDIRHAPIETRLCHLPCGVTYLADVLELSKKHEGIVAKRPGSHYPRDKRTKDWLKWRWEWGELP